MHLPLLLIFALLYSFFLPAQYAPPLRGPLLVTGTFGELRSDHYHGGLDFRASVGTPVRSVADGYVSRVRVSGGGFGQAVYVDHPDGKRSVYGHLEVLAPELKDTIRKLQYARQSFEIDFRPDSLAYPVGQGQVIGGVGNRGFSFGPHLHFEIREAATDAQLNPLSLGFVIPDTRQPQLRNLRLYTWADGEPESTAVSYDLIRNELPDTLYVAAPRIGFGLKAYDRQNSMPNWNGIYRANLCVDSTEVFSFDFDRVPLEKTAYINALTDYREWRRNSSWYYLLYTPVAEAGFWAETPPAAGDGILNLPAGVPKRVNITATDYAGNTSSVEVVVVHQPIKGPVAATSGKAAAAPHQYFLPAGEASIIDTAGLRLELDELALYEDLRFRYVRLEDASEGYLSDVHQLHDPETALHGRAVLRLRPRTVVPDSLRERVYIGKCGSDGAPRTVGGEWLPDGSMQTNIGAFGDYALLLDREPPEVRIRDFRSDLRGRPGFSLFVKDAVGGELGYRGTVDGEWVLLEYDAKSGTLTHTFEDMRKIGGNTTHRFELEITDGRGNRTTFTRDFRR
ncbi:M23 family metallopeptidase [Neolewinella litorea]|uniref:M23 family metallopeptidase n=1 Tax=Neolewinella litorea TaxID=2562452 RepID=A0A4S4NLT0_9BACT|nr:M23 family metallopeptidase [Neolewinella litorea]THH39301.1 M23 family metallopeptidase [Neolewinella litorea]